VIDKARAHLDGPGTRTMSRNRETWSGYSMNPVSSKQQRRSIAKLPGSPVIQSSRDDLLLVSLICADRKRSSSRGLESGCSDAAG
jgi:hypothetical protein